MKTVLRFLLEKLLIEKIAYAHCDIPCGIYDPHNAQMAAHTIIRMTQLLTEVKRDNPSTDSASSPQANSGQAEIKAEHDIARITYVKEDHSSLLEEELTTLENDYFREEHYKEYPKLQEHFSNANKLGAKARQNIDMTAAKELLEEVMQIAEIFYKTKGVEPVRVKTVYPTGGEIVLHK